MKLKPNIKIIKEWVKALRSGKYKQAAGKLKMIDDDGKERHCCLGVLCEIHNNHNPSGSWNGPRYVPSPVRNCKTSETVLPKSVRLFAGLKESDPVLITKTNGAIYTASELNDGGGYGFKRIATLIEKKYLKTRAYRIIKKPRKPKK